MIDKVLAKFLVSAVNILFLIFAVVGMYFHTLLTPALFIVWGITLAFIIQYIKMPSYDSKTSRSVIFAEWKTGGKRAPIIGHAGGSFDAPGNTLAAFREAAKNGADGVEFDLCLTKDNIGILMHDDSVHRTTDGSGLVSQMTYEEITKLDAAAKHPFHDKFKGTTVPTFEETIQECLKLDLVMYIDVKSSDPKIVSLIVEMFKKYKIHQRAIVCAFDPVMLYKVRSSDLEIITVQLMRPYLASYDGILSDAKAKVNSTFQLYKAMFYDHLLEWSVNSWLFYITGVSAMALHHDYLSMYMVDRWRTMGYEVITWTVNDKTEKSYLLSYNIPVITDSVQ